MLKAILPTDQYRVPRDTAARLNSFISSNPSETLGNIGDALAFLSEWAAEAEGLQSPEAGIGLALILEATRQAAKYEAHALDLGPKLHKASA